MDNTNCTVNEEERLKEKEVEGCIAQINKMNISPSVDHLENALNKLILDDKYQKNTEVCETVEHELVADKTSKDISEDLPIGEEDTKINIASEQSKKEEQTVVIDNLETDEENGTNSSEANAKCTEVVHKEVPKGCSLVSEVSGDFSEQTQHVRVQKKSESGEIESDSKGELASHTGTDGGVIFLAKGPVGGLPTPFTYEEPVPNEVSWPSMQHLLPGGRRPLPNIEHFDNAEQPIKFVRVGSGVPVENEDTEARSWTPDISQILGSDLLQMDILNELHDVPGLEQLDQLEQQAGGQLNQPFQPVSQSDLPLQQGVGDMRLGGVKLSNCAVQPDNNPVNHVFVSQASPGQYSNSDPQSQTIPDQFSEHGSPCMYPALSPSHNNSMIQKPYVKPYSNLGGNHQSGPMLHPNPAMQHPRPFVTMATQYSNNTVLNQPLPSSVGDNQALSPCQTDLNTLSPYSDVASSQTSSQYSQQLGSPASTSQDSPYMQVQSSPPDTGSTLYSPYRNTDEFSDCTVNSPDSALGQDIERATPKTQEQQQINKIAESLADSASSFMNAKKRQVPTTSGLPTNVANMILDSPTSPNVRDIIKERIIQRNPSVSESLKEKSSGGVPKSGECGSNDTKSPQPTTKETKKRGRPLGSKNKPKLVPKTTATKPILPDTALMGNVTSVIIIQQPNSSQSSSTSCPVVLQQSPGYPHCSYVQSHPTPIQPKVECKLEGQEQTRNTGPLVLPKPELHRPTGACKVSESSDDPSELEKKRKLKAERIVASISLKDLNYQDIDGDTLLHDLSLQNIDDLLESLFDKPMSLLTIGVVKDRYIFRALIERMQREGILKDMINMPNKLEQTPLYLAVATNKPDLLQLLLERGADPNKHTSVRSVKGEPNGYRMPLHVAAEKGRDFKLVLEMLLRSPEIDVNIKNSEHRTPLHTAVESHGSRPCQAPEHINNDQTVKILIQHSAKILKGPNERTPLYTLVERQDLHFLRYIVDLLPASEREDALNAKDSNGNTCLHIAASHTHRQAQPLRNGQVPREDVTVEMLETLLLVWEVDLSIKNNKNETAKMTVPKDNGRVLEIFREADTRRKNKNLGLKYTQMAGGLPNAVPNGFIGNSYHGSIHIVEQASVPQGNYCNATGMANVNMPSYQYRGARPLDLVGQ